MKTKKYTAKITILDPDQHVINEQEFSLDIQNGTINEIELSVSQFRNTVLSNIEKSLLENEQTEYLKKNSNVSCNGHNSMMIKTLHGSFQFKNQRFKNKDGCEAENYFEIAGHSLHHQCTIGLEELACRHARDITYGKSVEVIKDVSGGQQLSDQTIHKMVADRAQQMSEKWGNQAHLTLETEKMPMVNPTVDLYDPECKEVHLLVDAILVKEQKPIRNSIPKEQKHFVSTNLALLEKQNGEYAYLIGGVDEKAESQVGVSDMLKSALIEEYGTATQPLNIVAINDGARDIRTLLLSVFGILVTVILDWYHLKKKVNEYMSMFGLPLLEKKAKIKEVLHCLWRGKIDEAMGKVEQVVLPEMRMKWKEGLLGYFEKHCAEIINYEERKRLGKVIGSGRVESGVNQIVGERQKHNGMSWSTSGSKSLGILKVVQLNEQWNELFCSEKKAA